MLVRQKDAYPSAYLPACHWVPHSPSCTGILGVGGPQVSSVLAWLPPPGLCLPQEFRSDFTCPFLRIPSGLENRPSKLGENCPARSCPRTLGQVSSPCQQGRAQGGREAGRMPAGRGHYLQTESGSFLSTPENGAALLAQEVGLLQGKSPECLSCPPSKDQGATPGPPGNSPRCQSSGSSAERFCNRGQVLTLGADACFITEDAQP